MKVWIVNQYACAPDQPGSTRHFALARELQAQGHEPLIIAGSFDHRMRCDTRLKPGERWREDAFSGVPLLWLKAPAYGNNPIARLWNMIVFAWIVWRGKYLQGVSAPDAIIGSSPSPFAAWAALALARRYKVPFVLEVRDIWPASLAALGSVSSLNPVIVLFGRLEWHLYRHAAVILSLLPGLTEHAVARGADPEKVIWLPNGVDLAEAGPVRAPESDGPFRVMYAGAHGLANGLDTLIEVATCLEEMSDGAKDVVIELIGDGPHKTSLIEKVRGMGLDNVVFHEPVPKTEIFDHLARADAFVQILRRAKVFRSGVSPNKLYDYMAGGRPIIFAVEAANNPVAEAGAGVTVPPDDPWALAGAIRDLAAMPPEERQAMGQRGRQWVGENHSMGALGKKLSDILQSLQPRSDA